MKIRYQDYGAVAKIVITSTAFEFRKHNRIADTILFSVPEVTAERRGIFILNTVVSGRTKHMLRAYRTAQREAAR